MGSIVPPGGRQPVQAVSPQSAAAILRHPGGTIAVDSRPVQAGNRGIHTMTAEVPPVVLVVDDDPRALELMRLVLEHARYRVLTAQDPHDAISLLEAETPAVALFDYRMPGMNGLELTAWARAQPRLRGLRIVLLTGMDDEDTRRQGHDAGVDDVVTKPFDRKDLLHKLAALIQR